MKKDQDRFDKKPKKLKHSKNVPGVGMKTIGKQVPEKNPPKWYLDEDLDDDLDNDIQDNNEE